MKQRENTMTCNRPDGLTLPESPELEAAVLGALILEPEYLPDVAEIVEISTFSSAKNGKIYGAMLSMLAEGVTIDPYMLTQRCKTVEGIDNPAAYVAELTQAVGSGVNVIDHARQLAELESLRRLVMLGAELTARAGAGTASPEEVGGWIARQVEEITARVVHADDITPLSDAVRAALDDLERRQKAVQSGKCAGIPTGLQRLDALTGGWRGGQLVVLGGRPAMGKSAVMLHFARAAATAGVHVCVFSLEMSDEQLAGRMLVGGSGVDAGAFRTGNVKAAEWGKLEQAGADLSAMPVYLNDRANLSMNSIHSQCKAMHRRGRCGMVIIDYLQLADPATRNPNTTREREIAAASRAAKQLAKQLDVPVILLSQLSRKVEDRADKTPQLSDLRESGAIEQDADMVVLLDRPAMYGVETIETKKFGDIKSKDAGVLLIAKNREGATGRIYFRHNESLTRITDYDGPDAEPDQAPGPF